MFGNKSSAYRKLRFNGLEERRMMAGDVAVNVVDGVLNIEGDKDSNYVQIKQIDADTFEVQGVYAGGAMTGINGQTGSLTLSGVKAIKADMRDGNDVLTLHGNDSSSQLLVGDLNIETGGHDDTVQIVDFWVAGDVNINTDAAYNRRRPNDHPQGRDYVAVNDLVVYGSLDLTTGGQADSIAFTADGYGWNTAHEGYSIDSGQAFREGDRLRLNRMFTWAGMDIVTSQGGDSVTSRSLYSYNGNIAITTGGGNDSVSFADSDMNWQLTDYPTSVIINTGSGHDTVNVENVVVPGNVEVRTGSGHDDVRIHNVHARETLFADLGSGDDDLEITKSSAALAALYGGTHSKLGDKLFETSNAMDQWDVSGWEDIN